MGSITMPIQGLSILDSALSSLYAAPNDATDFAKSIVRLIDDPEMRDQLGEIGLRRITTDLSWEAQIPNLLAGYKRALLKRKAGVAGGNPHLSMADPPVDPGARHAPTAWRGELRRWRSGSARWLRRDLRCASRRRPAG